MARAYLQFILRFLGMATYRDDQIPATRYRLEGVRTYEVLVDDFDRIEEEASQVGTSLQFAMACIPVGIALTVTILTVQIPNERLYDGFFMFMLGSYGFGIFHGLQAWKQRGHLKKLMARIRARQGPPLGDQGKEFRAAELASLPLESAPASPPPTEKVTESLNAAVVSVQPEGEQK